MLMEKARLSGKGKRMSAKRLESWFSSDTDRANGNKTDHRVDYGAA
jgi:hypothetical protein